MIVVLLIFFGFFFLEICNTNRHVSHDVIESHDLTCLVGKRTNFVIGCSLMDGQLLTCYNFNISQNNKILSEVKNIEIDLHQ